MLNDNYLNDELDNYIEELNEIHIKTFKNQFKFSQDLWSFVEIEENFNHFKKFSILKNITDNDDLNTKNIIKKKSVKWFGKNKIDFMRPRISKKLINSKLNYFFQQNPTKWNQSLIKKISEIIKLPKSTIYKWNWNKIKI